MTMGHVSLLFPFQGQGPKVGFPSSHDLVLRVGVAAVPGGEWERMKQPEGTGEGRQRQVGPWLSRHSRLQCRLR